MGYKTLLEHRTTIEIRILASIMMKISTQALEQYLASQDINVSALQYGILRLLSFESYTISELSKKMLLDPSTLVPTVDALVKKGYVQRERDPLDRRRMPLRLTESGRSVLHDTPINPHDDPLHRALEGMSEADVTSLLDLLRRVVLHLPEGESILTEMQARLHTAHRPNGDEKC